MSMPAKKKLPIGVSDFASIINDNACYVDKTQLIMRLIDNNAKNSAILFTRPRRFGKTLNLDMLRCFFDCNHKEENRSLFEGLSVSQSPRHMEEQGKYPIIYLTFKNAKYRKWEQAQEGLCYEIYEFLAPYEYLEHSPNLTDNEKQRLRKLRSLDVNLTMLRSSLTFLCRILVKHHAQPVVLLIDEYDVPIQSAYQNGYYAEMIDFMRAFMTTGLKDNPNLRLAVITGVMRIAKDSLFSGLNNLTIDTILSEDYDDCFGFTQTDIEAMLEYYGKSEKLAELKDWYDGYRFGNRDIYNPWSVLRYFSQNCRADAYWLDTSSNDLTIAFLQRLEQDNREKVWELYRGGTVTAPIDTAVSYQQLDSCNSDILFSLMAVTGYLKPTERVSGAFYRLAIPNREIQTIYVQEIASHLEHTLRIDSLQRLSVAMVLGQEREFQNILNEYMLASLSYYDDLESFYHCWMMGVLIGLYNEYVCLSNREAGLGRADILLIPRSGKKLPGLVFELKRAETPEDLPKASAAALQQIAAKRYAKAFPTEVGEVRCFGIAFCGKECHIRSVECGELSVELNKDEVRRMKEEVWDA